MPKKKIENEKKFELKRTEKTNFEKIRYSLQSKRHTFS